MSDFVVVLAPAAEQDISDAFLWYRERNVLAADGFRAEVFDAVERIAVAPLSKPADNEGNRRRVLKRLRRQQVRDFFNFATAEFKEPLATDHLLEAARLIELRASAIPGEYPERCT